MRVPDEVATLPSTHRIFGWGGGGMIGSGAKRRLVWVDHREASSSQTGRRLVWVDHRESLIEPDWAEEAGHHGLSSDGMRPERSGGRMTDRREAISSTPDPP
ncbi:hypothetical protein [Dactylosporangium sp. CA-233914]|uniref:hypothetical protein n=1 Tax=Dactylosporangium sp. CA-233914 TaxID=3239934 RepID=UPI003D906395